MNKIKKAQEINRIIVKKIDSICKKFNITYFYIAGSLIGAVRHKSFIPWDDDIDLGFTRAEYEKLLKVPKEEWGEDFEIATAENIAPTEFLDYTNRVFYLKESLPQKTYDKVKNKLLPQYKDKMCIDLFILDPAYDSPLAQKILSLKMFLIYSQSMGHRSYIDYSEYSFFKKTIVFILSNIGKHRKLENLFMAHKKLALSAPTDSNSYFFSNYPINNTNVILSRSWFASTVPLQVDDDYFDGPVGYHELLTTFYGDYMKLPPEEERLPKHLSEK